MEVDITALEDFIIMETFTPMGMDLIMDTPLKMVGFRQMEILRPL